MTPAMKSREEMQRAHDILHFVTVEAPPIFDRDGAIAAHAAHDVLAWALGFPCGEMFQSNLDATLEAIREQGYSEVDVGQPISSEEARKRGLI